MSHAYPPDLARFAYDHLVDSGAGCDLPTLVEVLSVAYQASLLREEERPVSFRLLLSAPEAISLDGGPPTGNMRQRFERTRHLDAQEIRRLAPAAKMQRAMIGVSRTAAGLGIWGLLQTGPGWLHAIEGGAARSVSVPDGVSVTVAGPGRLVVSHGGVTIAKLAGGRVTGRSPDVFDSSWLPNACAENRRELFEAHERASGATAQIDQELVRKIDQQLVRRIIASIRLAHHGGTVILLPQDRAEHVARSDRPIALKYRFVDEEPRRRYRSLQMRLLDALASDPEGRAHARTWEAYSRSTLPEIVALDEALLDLAHGIAGLADVDGAVVMSKRFEVMGFGGEIVGDLPDVPVVLRALDLEGDSYQEESTDAVGTRHRSVYRLSASMPEALGIVISQDGGVRIVANKNGNVTYWEELGTGPMDI